MKTTILWEEKRSTSFSMQNISMEIQHGNYASVLCTIASPQLLNEWALWNLQGRGLWLAKPKLVYTVVNNQKLINHLTNSSDKIIPSYCKCFILLSLTFAEVKKSFKYKNPFNFQVLEFFH